MISKLWGLVLAALGIMAAVMLHLAGQRNRAREALARARAEAKSREAVQEAERAIDRAKQEARERSNDVQRESDNRPVNERPSGRLRQD